MAMNPDLIKKAEQLLRSAAHIYIFTHASLDGDALGSVGALILALRKAGYDNSLAIIGEYPPKRLAFLLPPKGTFAYANEINLAGTKEDLAILVDCANMGRLSEESKRIAEGCGKKIKIDHHLPCEGSDFADLDFTNSKWAATCEGLHKIIKDIDYEIGIRLYTGILTDSGRFTYSCTTGETLRTVAEIVDVIGTCNTWVSETTFDKKPASTFKLHAIAFEKMKSFADGKFTACYLTVDDFRRAGAEINECQAIVAELLKVDGAVMSFFLRPNTLTDDCTEFRVSMRSSEPFDVGSICQKFGGGGHKCASGATQVGDGDEIFEKIIAEAVKTFQ